MCLCVKIRESRQDVPRDKIAEFPKHHEVGKNLIPVDYVFPHKG